MKTIMPSPSRLGLTSRRTAVWITLFMLAGVWCTAPLVTTARAQTEEGELEMLDESATVDDGTAEPATGSTTSTADPEAEERSLLDTLIDGGIVGLLIGLLSVVSLGFIIEHSMSIRKNTLIPEDVADELETLIQQGKIDAAIEASEDPNNESLIADVVLAGLRR